MHSSDLNPHSPRAEAGILSLTSWGLGKERSPAAPRAWAGWPRRLTLDRAGSGQGRGAGGPPWIPGLRAVRGRVPGAEGIGLAQSGNPAGAGW